MEGYKLINDADIFSFSRDNEASAMTLILATRPASGRPPAPESGVVGASLRLSSCHAPSLFYLSRPHDHRPL